MLFHRPPAPVRDAALRVLSLRSIRVSGSCLRAALVLVALSMLLPAVATAKPRGQAQKEAAAVDQQIVRAMHLRDRGLIDEAIVLLQEVIGEHPDAVDPHRLYQEMAVLSRRNPRLVEAEYRHYLADSPDDPRRLLLHASARMAALVITPELQNREVVREIERAIAAAEASPDLVAESHLVAADLNHYIGQPVKVEEHLRAGLKADPFGPALRSDMVAFLSGKGEYDEAAELCLELIEDVPWRLFACALMLPRRAGDVAVATVEDQERIVARLEALETERPDDSVTLQSLEWVYDVLGEKRGSKRLRVRLAELEPGWTPPLQRNPYLKALAGGELGENELVFLKQMEGLREADYEDGWGRVRALQAAEATLPESPRMRSYFYRELAYALRADDVLDRDASRAAVRKALESTPDDPSVMNEWAYMSALDEVDLVDALETVERALALLLGEPFTPLAISPGEGFSDFEIERSDSVGAYIDTRGWLLYRLGRHEEAVRDLTLASLLTGDGTVHGHLGRARFAVGDDVGAFQHLVRALALGTEDEQEVTDLARHLYEKLHVVPGGLETMVEELRRQIRAELEYADALFGGLDPHLDADGGRARPGDVAPPLPDRHARTRAGHALIGEVAPDFTFTTLSGDEISAQSLKGRLVVVDFWATWCAPCVEAIPMMDALARTFAKEGVVFVALSMDDSEAAVRRFWTLEDSPIRVGMAGKGVPDAFDVEGIPATFVIDASGRIADFHAGYDARTAEALTMSLIRLLAGVK